jgi:hypothetical protein
VSRKTIVGRLIFRGGDDRDSVQLKRLGLVRTVVGRLDAINACDSQSALKLPAAPPRSRRMISRAESNGHRIETLDGYE